MSNIAPYKPDLLQQEHRVLLQIYTYYRTILSAILLLMYQWEIGGSRMVGSLSPELFFNTTAGYTITNIFTLLFLWLTNFKSSRLQLFSLVFIDICALITLMHASGGIQSGLGYLILVSVSAGAIFMSRTPALLLAALASILTIGETVYSNDFQKSTGWTEQLFSAGTLGILLFISALLLQHFSQKIRADTEQLRKKTLQANHLQSLAQHIVQRMRTGIMVADQTNSIILSNQAALDLLGFNTHKVPPPAKLNELPQINNLHKKWQAKPQEPLPNIQLPDDSGEIQVGFAKLDSDGEKDTLIFIDDNAKITQQAQQLKLASLGRLTASIAHEIRNPLGAISHAAQLLAESQEISRNDIRMTEIIENHTQRVNHIIENVLQLSRRQAIKPELIQLNSWLKTILTSYSAAHPANPDIKLEASAGNLHTRGDPNQIFQAISSLLDNALRYSEQTTGESKAELQLKYIEKTDQALLDIIDNGNGIEGKDIDRIFEPFYTTENTGSGLGLYIAKELCESNFASLIYRRTPENKSCFRIIFAQPQRIF